MDAAQAKTELNRQIDALCAELLPNGSRKGREWCVGNIKGSAGDSLKIHLAGNKAGVWCDFATGESGDVLDLVMQVRGSNLIDAIKWSREWLGLPDDHVMSARDAYHQPRQYKKPVKPQGLTKPQSAVMAYLTENRGIKSETIEAFQIGEVPAYTFRAKAGEITCPAVVFPLKVDGELRMIKYLGTERPDGKKLIAASADCEPVLFGWQAMPQNARSVIICEGEINAMSWHQYGINALATPFGAGKAAKHAWIAQEWERLAQFEIIYLNFDQDGAGREAVADLVDRLGRHRCRVVAPFPDGQKDVNDCLFAGMAADQIQAHVEKSRSLDPSELKPAQDFTDAVIEAFYPEDNTPQGIPIPVAGFGDKLAFRPGETTIVSGYRGHGKTEGLNWIVNNGIIKGERVLMASFEMRAVKLLHRAVRQVTAQRTPSVEYIRQVMNFYDDHLWIFDHVGSAKIDRVLEVFEYARRRYGITLFVIDSLMKLGIAEDDYTAQGAAMDKFSKFNNTHNTHGIMVAHSRKDADEHKVPSNNDVKGAGSITDQADNVLIMWRNKRKEMASQKSEQGEQLSTDEASALNEPDVKWFCDKQREGDGWIGMMGLGFDGDSKQFVSGEGVRPLVPFQTVSVNVYDDDYVPEF